MNEVWDLSILYKDFDDPAFTGDMKALDEAIAAVNTLAGEAAGMEHSQLVHRFLQVQERVEELANKLFIFCSLRCSANTADTKANSLGDQLSAKLSGCAAANASLRRTVAELEDLDAIMDADPALEPYRFLLESIRRDSKYLLTDREEELFARMNISGASAWESLRDNLTSSVKVEYDGGITNLSAIRNLAYDPDRLCQMMLEAQKKAYGDGLDQTCLHPYMWLCKGHYYSGGLSFYNFPYAFGGLFARGLYAKYQQEGKDFVPLYKKMLHATSVTCVEDTAKIAGIDLTDKAFWRQGLQFLADEIDLFCQLVK